MITKHIVIQKIEEDGQVGVFQISSDYFQWTFETSRTKTDEDTDYFPFNITGDINIINRRPGAETKTYKKENEITFVDDYSVPGGFVIAILFPKNHIPDIIKFKDPPFIPAGIGGQVTTNPPGQFRIFYNRLEKQSAIVFNIHNNICFGFKCIAKKVTDENFPKNESIIADDFFDISISTELLNIETIQNEDLKIINETLNKTDLDEINKTLNEILQSLKSGQKTKAKSLIASLGQTVLTGTGLASNLTTIIDSYKNAGIAQQFVGRILEYISL